jgi:hypothetical protein
MARSIGLSAYNLRLKNARKRNEDFLTMQSIGDINAYELFHQYLLERLNNIRRVVHKKDEESASSPAIVAKVFKLVDLKTDKASQTFSGLIHAGECGRANSIYNTVSGEVAHEKTLTEADMPPFYFRLHVPDGKKKAVLILQRTGLHGLKSAIDRDMSLWFSEKKLTLTMASLTDNDLLERYLTFGTVDEITVITHKQQADSRTLLNNSRIAGHKPPKGMRVELKMSSAEGFAKRTIEVAKKAVRRTGDVKDLVEVEGLDNPEEVIFRVDYDGKPKKFSIQHAPELGISYDVTDEIAYDSKNHPVFSSIDQLAVQHCMELMDKLD